MGSDSSKLDTILNEGKHGGLARLDEFVPDLALASRLSAKFARHDRRRAISFAEEPVVRVGLAVYVVCYVFQNRQVASEMEGFPLCPIVRIGHLLGWLPLGSRLK